MKYIETVANNDAYSKTIVRDTNFTKVGCFPIVTEF